MAGFLISTCELAVACDREWSQCEILYYLRVEQAVLTKTAVSALL